MKKGIILITGIIAVIIAGTIYIENKKPSIENQWLQVYTQKKKNYLEGKPGTKQIRIREIDKYFKGLRTKFDGTEKLYPANHLMKELEKAKRNTPRLKSADNIEWISRGPGNVGSLLF